MVPSLGALQDRDLRLLVRAFYIIYKKDGSPWCSERFIGYGSNKAACLYEIYLSGIDYYVLPDDFLIHQNHKYPEHTRRKERQYNKKLYSNFREELCLRF